MIVFTKPEKFPFCLSILLAVMTTLMFSARNNANLRRQALTSIVDAGWFDELTNGDQFSREDLTFITTMSAAFAANPRNRWFKVTSSSCFHTRAIREVRYDRETHFFEKWTRATGSTALGDYIDTGFTLDSRIDDVHDRRIHDLAKKNSCFDWQWFRPRPGTLP